MGRGTGRHGGTSVTSPPLSSVIDLSEYRLDALPDENSDEDWDDDVVGTPDPEIVVAAADVLESDRQALDPTA